MAFLAVGRVRVRRKMPSSPSKGSSWTWSSLCGLVEKVRDSEVARAGEMYAFARTVVIKF